MKKIFNIHIITVLALGLVLSSCWKQDKASDYAPLLNINGYTASSQIASTNLISHWTFNGTLTDSLTNTTATADGTTFGPGLLGQALAGGTNAYATASVPAAIQSLHSFSVSSWVNMSSADSSAVYELVGIANPVGFWSNLDVFFDGGGTATTDRLKIHVFNNGLSGTGVDAWLGDYTVNNPYGWVNVTLTYDDTSSTFVVYYNGASIANTVVAGFAPLNWAGVTDMIFGTFPFMATPSLTTGATPQSWATYLPGSLDEIRFYNRVLTSTEVTSLVALQHRGK
jgi:hypothetical protein